MSIFGRRMTPELLASELLHGLESGEIVFDELSEPAEDQVTERVAALVEAALAPVRTQLQTTVDQAAAILKQAENDRRETAESLGQARAILAEVVQVAARLRDGSAGKRLEEFGTTLGSPKEANVFRTSGE